MIKITAATLTTGLAIASSGYYLYENNLQFKRTITLWIRLGPIISHYRLYELGHKLFSTNEESRNKNYESLHNKYADAVLKTFQDLRGFYIKVGQMMANRNQDLPEIYIEKLRTLEDAVPPLMNGQQVIRKIQQSLNLTSFDDIFTDFQETPIGSASIGQVHKATLKKNQRQVAIKVQSPETETLFRHDVKSARNFCSVFAPEQCILFDEIEKQFLTEFNYVEEAKHLYTIKENMKPFHRLVKVPEPFLEYCSKDVLVMEYLQGPKLVDGIREMGHAYAALHGTTLESMERELRDKYNREGLPAVYKGPSAFQMDMYTSLIKTKDFLFNLPIYPMNVVVDCFNYLFGVHLSRISLYKSFIPLNSSRIMDTLLRVHGHQLLVNGYFNADPHPGNFLLLPDGRIGLLDYGQVKRLDKSQRLVLARLYLALANQDMEQVVEISRKAGYKSKYYDPLVIYKMSIIGFDQGNPICEWYSYEMIDGRHVTEGMNIQQYVDKMYSIDPWDSVLDYFIMPTRMSLLLRGVGYMLQHPVSVATAWKDIAQHVLQSESEFESE